MNSAVATVAVGFVFVLSGLAVAVFAFVELHKERNEDDGEA